MTACRSGDLAVYLYSGMWTVGDTNYPHYPIFYTLNLVGHKSEAIRKLSSSAFARESSLSTSSCSLYSWFNSFFAQITSLQPHLLSHRLSIPSRFTAGLKTISSTNPFLHSLSGSIWIAFTEFGLGPDLLGFSFVFCFFLFLATRAALPE